MSDPFLDRSKEDLIKLCIHMQVALDFMAGHLTSEEGDVDETEEMFGLDASEVIEMAHDNMILRARQCLDAIKKEPSDEDR